MKRMKLVIILIAVVFVFISGCGNKEKVQPYYSEPIAQLVHDVQENGDKIYYINPLDDKLYLFDKEKKTSSIVLDQRIWKFYADKDYLIYVGEEESLRKFDLYNKTDKIMAEHVDGYNITLYDDRIVTRIQGAIKITDFNGQVIYTSDEGYVHSYVPYQDKICYTVERDRFFNPNSIMLIDLNGNFKEKVEDRFAYRLWASGDGLYYLDEVYQIVKLNPEIEEKAERMEMVDLFSWGIGDDFIVSTSKSDGLYVCDINGENKRTIEEERYKILDAENNIFIYYDADNKDIIIYNVDTNIKSTIEIEDDSTKCIISDSVIYVVFGHSTDDGDIETSGGLYNYNGELVYGF